MTKADLVNEVTSKTGIEKSTVLATIEAVIKTIKTSMSSGENVYLRGFGTFVVKTRAEKPARIIASNKQIIIPAHKIPSFKPAKTFKEKVKKSVV